MNAANSYPIDSVGLARTRMVGIARLLLVVMSVALGVLGGGGAARADCEPLTPSNPCSNPCLPTTIDGRTVYYCFISVVEESTSPLFGNCNRDGDGDIDPDDIREFVWQSIACAPTDWWRDPDNIITLICWYMSGCSEHFSCVDAFNALFDIFNQLYCRPPTMDEYRRLAQCLGNCLTNGTCQAESGGVPCHFEPSNADCDLNDDSSTDCEDTKIFVALSALCCGKESLTPSEIIALLCLWYSADEGNICGREDPVECSEVLNCAEQIIGSPLTGDQMAQLMQCTNCNPDCPPKEGETCPPPTITCDENGDGAVDCADLTRYIARANECKLRNCEEPLTEAEKIQLICDFLSECTTLGDNRCALVEDCAGGILNGPGGSLTQDQRDALAACSGCTGGGTPSNPGAPPGGSAGKSSDNGNDPGCGGAAGSHSANPDKGDHTGDRNPGKDGGQAPKGDDAKLRDLYEDFLRMGGGQIMPYGLHPVSYTSGLKMESATDLVVSVAGGTFALTRHYTSDTGYAGASLVGNNWMPNVARFVVPGATPSTDPIRLYGPQMDRYVEFTLSSGTWKAGAGSHWYITQVSSVSIGGVSYDVWRLTEPGLFEMDFYRAGGGTLPSGLTSTNMQGLLLQSRDAYGNVFTYQYRAYGSTTKYPRLTMLYLGGDSDADAEARVSFIWNGNGSSSTTFGKLSRAIALRKDGSGTWFETDRVEYTYFESGDTAALGSAGDLIQVTKRFAVDAAPSGPASRPTIIQYRYHNEAYSETSGDDDRLEVDGKYKQLKLVIMPEQVEYYAQVRAAAGAAFTSGTAWQPHEALEAAATELLAKADGDSLFTLGSTTYKLIDIAAKIISYDTSASPYPVVAQYLQGGCGCTAGSSQGLKLGYEYIGPRSTYPTTKITEYEHTGVASGSDYTTTHRTVYIDMEYMSGISFLRNVAVYEGSGGGRRWVTHIGYDTTLLVPTKVMLPSALSTYSIATSMPTAASYAPSTSDGLVYGYSYNSESRVTEVRLSEGDSGTDEADVSGFTLLSRTTYPSSDGTNERTYLPNKVEAFTDEADTSSADKIETTWFKYGFHGGSGSTNIAWVRTLVEAELEGEIALTSDTVYEQTEPTYNSGDGLLTRVTHRQRIHDSSTTGALTATISVSTFVDSIYDAADRRIGSINYGTNDTTGKQFIANTTGPSIQSSLPAFTDGAFADAIISKMAYNTRGLVDSTSDSTSTDTDADRTTKYLYDDMGRRIAVIENYDDAVVEWDGTNDRWTVSSGLDDAEQDTDRVTSFVYDGNSNVVKQIAHTVNSSDQETVQITEYVYGVDAGSASTATDSLIYSNDILAEVHYPDESTGQPGTTDYTVSYSYNALGELRSVVDQNGTTHAYSRDLLGRVTSDAASFPGGSTIDQTVRSIAVSYDDFSRLETVDSKNSGGTVLNSVQLGYTGLWQVASVEQDVDGAIGAGGIAARTVGYTYDNSESDNHSLLQSLDYPDGTSFTYTYGPSTAEGRIARVGSMDISGTGGYTVANYSYVGLGMFAGVDYPVPDIQLDRTLSSDGKRRLVGYTSQTDGVYPGWDQFGRVRYHAWVDGNLTTGTGGHPDRPQLFAETYTYDRASNRTARYDDVPRYTNTWVSRDWQFQYDDLDRLTQSLRGTWNGSTLTLNKGSQDWTLDMLGNWSAFKEDKVPTSGSWGSSPTYTDSGDQNETRDHNSANELTQINPPTPAQPLLYDHAGNMTDYTQPGGAVKRTYVHDAWNRLVKVENRNASSGALIGTLAEYEYNGLHWRTVKRADTDQTPDNAIDQQRLMYYNASWQLVEEHIDDAFTPTSGSSGHSDNRVSQNFWGLRYIDDMILRRIDDVGTGAGGSYEGRWFYLTDVQFSVRSLVRANGVVEENIDYDPYGKATYHDPSDFDGDGVANSSDFFAFLNAWFASDRSTDFNRDGAINSQDYNDFSTANASPVSVPSGWISDVSPSGVGSGSGVGPDNQFGFDGYVFNAETGDSTARFRYYSPVLGRWLARDPIGYIASMSLFEYVNGRVLTRSDTIGLCSTCQPESDDHKSCSFDDYLKKWYEQHPGLSDEQKALVKEVLKTGCVGITVINLYGNVQKFPDKRQKKTGFAQLPNLRNCFKEKALAEERQKVMQKDCDCPGQSTPQLFSIHFWANGKFPKEIPNRDGLLDMSAWGGNVEGKPCGGENCACGCDDPKGHIVFDFGFVDGEGRIWHANTNYDPNMEGGGMKIYCSTLEQWRKVLCDFTDTANGPMNEVWCVACNDGQLAPWRNDNKGNKDKEKKDNNPK